MKIRIGHIIGCTFLLSMGFQHLYAQELKLKVRKPNAMGGKAFAMSLLDTAISLETREELIYREIKSGNVPDFLRKFKEITIRAADQRDGKIITLRYQVLPDYLAIGSNEDFFYVPMTPILAQKLADLTHCSLPTKLMVDSIHKNAKIKLEPKPIPPTKAMITVPVFIAHTDSVLRQLAPVLKQHSEGALTSGNKKDVIISNKIYGEKTSKVVIYGWHKSDGKAIQPVYNKHTNLWADYSHGIRFISQKIQVIIDGRIKKTSLKKLLNSSYAYLLSDEGLIQKPFYPITSYESTTVH